MNGSPCPSFGFCSRCGRSKGCAAHPHETFAAGYEAAVRDMWRGALLVVAGNLEASARRAEASRDFAPLWTSWAADRRAEAAQLRAWAREGA